jgi:HSP20 family protein
MLWRERNGNRFSGLGRRSLFGELDRLQREMNRLVGSQPAANEFPLVNIWSGAEGVQITAEIPGIEPEAVTISVVGNTLTLSGQRPELNLGEGQGYHRRERVFGDFTRTIELPFRVDVENVDAAFSKGVLTITLPRAAEERPKKIQIKAE